MPADSRKRTAGDDFMDDECGKNALQLTARGNVLIAEILRLSEFIPQEFRTPDQFPDYKHIITDFRYFRDKEQEAFERTIQSSAELLQRDDVFRETHLDLLKRFFQLFRAVYSYLQEVNRFVEDIEEGLYVSQSLESILAHNEGKQLMCEIYYLFGVMLLLLDMRIGGKTREHLIVSYVHYEGGGEEVIAQIASLFRSTGRTSERLPPEYPVEYFARAPGINKRVITLLLGRIRSDDIYRMLYNYPDPEHRSTALAQQGAMLFVLLFFLPNTLRDRPVMREVVDKHFADGWIIAYYMGFTVDVSEYWKPFPGAHAAISATTAKENIAHTKAVLGESVHASNQRIGELLRDGVLTDQFVLDSIGSKLIPVIRHANVALRWFILHRACLDPPAPSGTKPEALRKMVTSDDILKLLLQLSQLEFILKDRFAKLLKEKRRMWNEAKEQGVSKMNKLSAYYSGEEVLSDNVRMVHFQEWFAETAEKIDALNYASSTKASQTIQKLMKAMDNVTEYHQVNTNMQVMQFIGDTKTLLRQMIRVTNIEEKIRIMISTIGDLSYAWERFATERCFVAEIHDIIRRDPRLTIQMRSAFVKMSSVMEMPCGRIAQMMDYDPAIAESLENVSSFYSSQLVTFVKHVLHVIPSTIFEKLSMIADLLVNDLQPCPTKIPRKDLKEQSQLDVRAKLAMLTSQVSQFACGILAMESTLVGVIDVDPHQLLEDGVRSELRKRLSSILATFLTTTADQKRERLTTKHYDEQMTQLAQQLQGLRQSFEYVQDYIDVHGLRIWLQEFSRIVNFNVEMECNAFMHRKVYPWKSRFYAVGIPTRPYETGVYPCSFLGRLMHAVVMLSRESLFLPPLCAWYDAATGMEMVGDRTFECISVALGCQGLAALNRLMGFLSAKQIDEILTSVRRRVEARDGAGDLWRRQLLPTSAAIETAGDAEVDMKVIGHVEEVLTPQTFKGLTDALEQIGRLQLLRECVLSRLRSDARLNSAALFSALGTTNRGLIADLERHYENPIEHPMPGEIIAETASFLESSGMDSASGKVYTTTRPLPEAPFVLAALVVKAAPQWTYDPAIAALKPAKRGAGSLDAACFAHGVLTVMRQFHSEQRKMLFGLLNRSIRALFRLTTDAVRRDASTRTALQDHTDSLVRLTDYMARENRLDPGVVHEIVPIPLLTVDPSVLRC